VAEIFDIALVGTSLTTGIQNRNWPLCLQRTLQAGKSQEVRVYAAGKGASTSNWGLTAMPSVARMKTRVVGIEFVNDALNNFQAPETTYGINMTLERSRSNFVGMIDILAQQSPDTKVFLMTMLRPPAEVISMAYTRLLEYYALLPQIAAEKGVGFIDCYAAWGDPALHPDEFPPQDVHALLPGYLRVAVPTIAAQIGRLIR
jgi:lysophospholipase L1-like esterase